MDLHAARLNMVQQQVRPWDVLNPKVLHALSIVPREAFVLPNFQTLACSDAPIPIGYEQVTLSPNVIGRMLQSLALTPHETVVEIGTGTGYMTSLLSHLAKKVLSVEIIPELSHQAEKLLGSLNINNVLLEVGNAVKGWPIFGPYPAMVFTGSFPFMPKKLLHELIDQLAFNGRLFVVIGVPKAMQAKLITRLNNNEWTEEILFETDIPSLSQAPQPKLFKF